MFNNITLFSVFFLASIFMVACTKGQPSLTKEYNYWRNCNVDHGWSNPQCFDDKSGYYRLFCNEEFDWDTERWTWNKDQKPMFVRCGEKQKCGCKSGAICSPEDMCNDIDVKYPTFPQYGLLTYTGIQAGNDDYGYDAISDDGKTAKDESGRYYNEYKAPVIGYTFELVLPKNGTFVKYTGRPGNKHCSKQTVKTTYKTTLFKTYRWYTGYKKTSEYLDEDGKYLQKWYQKYWDGDPSWGLYDTTTYTYIYNKTTNVAIPYRYHHFHQYDGADRTDTRNYIYSPVVRDNSIFDVKRYCSNV